MTSELLAERMADVLIGARNHSDSGVQMTDVIKLKFLLGDPVDDPEIIRVRLKENLPKDPELCAWAERMLTEDLSLLLLLFAVWKSGNRTAVQ